MQNSGVIAAVISTPILGSNQVEVEDRRVPDRRLSSILYRLFSVFSFAVPLPLCARIVQCQASSFYELRLEKAFGSFGNDAAPFLGNNEYFLMKTASKSSRSQKMAHKSNSQGKQGYDDPFD